MQTYSLRSLNKASKRNKNMFLQLSQTSKRTIKSFFILQLFTKNPSPHFSEEINKTRQKINKKTLSQTLDRKFLIKTPNSRKWLRRAPHFTSDPREQYIRTLHEAAFPALESFSVFEWKRVKSAREETLVKHGVRKEAQAIVQCVLLRSTRLLRDWFPKL